MSGREVAEALQVIERKVDEAAAALVPVMTGAATDAGAIAVAIHDALNSLAAVRLRAGLALELLQGRP